MNNRQGFQSVISMSLTSPLPLILLSVKSTLISLTPKDIWYCDHLFRPFLLYFPHQNGPGNILLWYTQSLCENPGCSCNMFAILTYYENNHIHLLISRNTFPGVSPCPIWLCLWDKWDHYNYFKDEETEEQKDLKTSSKASHKSEWIFNSLIFTQLTIRIHVKFLY